MDLAPDYFSLLPKPQSSKERVSELFSLILYLLFFLYFGCPGSFLLHASFSLDAVNRDCYLVAVLRRLISVASLVVEHRL